MCEGGGGGRFQAESEEVKNILSAVFYLQALFDPLLCPGVCVEKEKVVIFYMIGLVLVSLTYHFMIVFLNTSFPFIFIFAKKSKLKLNRI